MKRGFSLLAVTILVLAAWAGVEVLQLTTLFGVVIPYTALLVFVGGFI